MLAHLSLLPQALHEVLPPVILMTATRQHSQEGSPHHTARPTRALAESACGSVTGTQHNTQQAHMHSDTQCQSDLAHIVSRSDMGQLVLLGKVCWPRGPEGAVMNARLPQAAHPTALPEQL